MGTQKDSDQPTAQGVKSTLGLDKKCKHPNIKFSHFGCVHFDIETGNFTKILFQYWDCNDCGKTIMLKNI